jgi:hypothetical protein
LNVYTTLHRADGHAVKMHMDQWEGQVFQISPGNLYSEPRKMTIDPRKGGTIRLVLDRKIPPIPAPSNTEYVKHIPSRARCFRVSEGARFSSARRFCCRGTTTEIPRSSTRSTTSRVTSRPAHGGFGEPVETRPGADEREKQRAKQRSEFTTAWLRWSCPFHDAPAAEVWACTDLDLEIRHHFLLIGY